MNDDLGPATQLVEGVLMSDYKSLLAKIDQLEQQIFAHRTNYLIHEEPDLEDL